MEVKLCVTSGICIKSAMERPPCTNLHRSGRPQALLVASGTERHLFKRAKEATDGCQPLAKVVHIVAVGIADTHALGLLKGVAGRNQSTLGLHHANAEVIGVDVVVVVHECRRASLRLAAGEV